MNSLEFFIVDVFAETKYSGNQLAVFPRAGQISPEIMQRITKEINYSETTFITHHEAIDGGYNVRIFTPAQEVTFAGHPTLGTAYIIQRELIKAPVAQVNLNLLVGQIPVTFAYQDGQVSCLQMQQKPPKFGQVIDPGALAEVLNLEGSEIDVRGSGAEHYRFPCQEVSTGIPFIIVPLKNHHALKRAKVNRDKYFKLIETTDAKCIFIFCPETNHPQNHLSGRMFGDYLGVPEDPATGSANGCLAGYLVKYRYFGEDNIDVRVEQGYEIDRPSLLFLQAYPQANGEIAVFVGGSVQLVAKGEFL
ncbi:phenazine biosynthesis protein [Planktothricoides sp. SR001]|uniref:PhzF family phenazine biosynthesis protein n=1 Tax=Planktothricoides sp. SR001 TaxID=1705388 RepID=UPI0006C4C312|nr:PhzF family phenazine biosynthesis protein [Planktothricoides sp. SR001]KOR35227.1 phenazine biosynthesis protein [Planktothricoides sp. SR001]